MTLSRLVSRGGGATRALALVAFGSSGCYPDFDYLLDPSMQQDGGAVDSGPPSEACDAAVPEGSTYTALYADFFGPTGAASCTAGSICHVAQGNGGTHWLCGTDQESCWKGMTSGLVPAGGSQAPEETVLYQALRKAPPNAASSGPMPRNSSFAFKPEDLERIEGWICSGAHND